MKPSGTLRIRLPPPTPITTTNGAVKYAALTFEVGVLTPEGIFPLGTATYQPLQKSSTLQHVDVLKVDPIHKGSIFQRKKPLTLSPKSSTIVTTNDKDSKFRLLRKSKLSLHFDIKPLSDEEYMAQKRKQEPKPMNDNGLPKSPSCPALDSNNKGIATDEFLPDGVVPNELQNTKSDPSGGLITYLSDPLSCCSDRDVESDDEEVVPDDAKTQVTEPCADLLNEDAPAQTAMSTALSMDDIELENVAQEPELQREIIPTTGSDVDAESYGWGCFFPICCCVGTSKKTLEDFGKDATNKFDHLATGTAKDNGVSSYDTLVQGTGTSAIYLGQGEQVKDETLNRSRHRYSDEVDAILRSDSDMKELQDRSVVGTRNCCMLCFGDEDVENLKFAKLKSTRDEQEHLMQTDESTDAIFDGPIEQKHQSGSNELTHPKPEVIVGQDEHTRTAGGTVEADEIAKNKNNVDGDLTPHVNHILDTMSSSYTEEQDDTESIYSASFSDIDGNVGCFQWMGAVSSDGLVTDNSMSVVSSESQSDSVEEVVVDAGNSAKIPISKSDDVTTVLPTSIMKNKLLIQSNSIS
jgi:hypothetical protein